MSKIERGQFSSFLRRYLGMTGVSEVVDELAPEISAVFALEQERPEWEFLKGARLMSHATQVTVNPGNPNSARWRNPPNSGVVAIFYRVNASVSTVTGSGLFLTMGAQLADLATVSGTVPRDTRWSALAVGGAIIASFSNSGAIGGNQFDNAIILANTTWSFLHDTPVVITPGNSLQITTSATGLDSSFSAHWLEKRLDDLERQ